MSQQNSHKEMNTEGILVEPCPWCRRVTRMCTIAFRNMGNQVEMVVQCYECKCIGPIGDPRDDPDEAEESALAKWNDRTGTINLPPMEAK